MYTVSEIHEIGKAQTMIRRGDPRKNSDCSDDIDWLEYWLKDDFDE